MTQNEDTELRDLVVEALEKNGSLATIRALLRTNVFLAFEDDFEKVKHNVCLDNLLKMPEGIVILSLIHEFLEFCNLKNTLFVYMAETRQGKEYSYEGKKALSEKLNLCKEEQTKEPLLLTLLKKLSKSNCRKQCEKGICNKDDQNCTYIVHEDSSNGSHTTSHSDQSSDEKNKLLLRLPLDHSDTDTSSDSTRDKSSSEYIPNENIVIPDESEDDNKSNLSQNSDKESHSIHPNSSVTDVHLSLQQVKNHQQSTSKVEEFNVSAINNDCTSYAELKPFNSTDLKMFNTSGLPGNNHKLEDKSSQRNNGDSTSAAAMSNQSNSIHKEVNASQVESKTPSYSYDFSVSLTSKTFDSNVDNYKKTQDQVMNSAIESPHKSSQSSRSSISISDVADLVELSDTNSPRVCLFDKDDFKKEKNDLTKKLLSIAKEAPKSDNLRLASDASGDFSESSVPSLSNLSLDYHSD